MSRKYKFHNPSAAYFVSFATVYWIDVFTRQVYFNILSEGIEYCRANKGMELFTFCFMPSHIHFIFRSTNADPMGLLRDYKKNSAKKILKAIQNNPQESRKEWLLKMFSEAGEKNKDVSRYQFWQHHNKPIELWSTRVIKQKIDYIHNNPVQAGFVTNQIDWKWSSARNFAEEDPVIQIDDMGFVN